MFLAGVDMGHLCNNAHSAKTMAMSISNLMRTRLKTQLKNAQAPLTIILDGSTSKREKHFAFLELTFLLPNHYTYTI